MNEVVFNTLKEKDFIVKSYILRAAVSLELSLNETILLIYFSNQEIPQLNIDNITLTTTLSKNQILEAFSRLSSIGVITMDVVKNPNGTMEEVISLDNLIKNITVDITSKQKEVESNNIFEIFEREFGRQLSTYEYEVINEWLNNYSKELIEEALKESILNGVKSLKYISKILFAWNEKGINSKKEINEEKSSSSELLESLYNVDWLNE